MYYTYKKKFALRLIVALSLLIGCSKSDSLNLNIPGLGGDTWSTTEIDKWIKDSLTDPYNISMKYRFDRSELDVSKTLVPPDESKVIPVATLVKRVFLQSYEDVAGATFIKSLTPKEFIMVGSPSYNSNGSVTIGEAEGGRKITLFEANSYSNTNRAFLIRVSHTIHHEFGHILNQNKIYDPTFKKITPGDYTSDWTNQSAGYTDRGFITQYAQSAPDEDFVETLATLLVEGQDYFDGIMKGASADGATKLLQKETIVKNYMKTSWKIDFDSLQRAVKLAINSIVPEPGMFDILGSGLQFSNLGISTKYTQSAAFAPILTTLNTNLQSKFGFKLDSVALKFDVPSRMAVVVRFSLASNSASYYYANFIYSSFKDAVSNTWTFSYINNVGSYYDAWNGNADYIASVTNALVTYFNASFSNAWPAGYNLYSVPAMGLFIKTSDNTSTVLGTLSK